MEDLITKFYSEIRIELEDNILKYWIENTLDEVNGGFHGQMSYQNEVNLLASKSSVLNTRILWAFSAAYNYLKDEKYLKIANRAYK